MQHNESQCSRDNEPAGGKSNAHQLVSDDPDDPDDPLYPIALITTNMATTIIVLLLVVWGDALESVCVCG